MKFPKETLDEYTKKVQEHPDGDFVDMKDLDDIMKYAEYAHAKITELENLLLEQDKVIRNFQAVRTAVQKLLS